MTTVKFGSSSDASLIRRVIVGMLGLFTHTVTSVSRSRARTAARPDEVDHQSHDENYEYERHQLSTGSQTSVKKGCR